MSVFVWLGSCDDFFGLDPLTPPPAHLCPSFLDTHPFDAVASIPTDGLHFDGTDTDLGLNCSTEDMEMKPTMTVEASPSSAEWHDSDTCQSLEHKEMKEILLPVAPRLDHRPRRKASIGTGSLNHDIFQSEDEADQPARAKRPKIDADFVPSDVQLTSTKTRRKIQSRKNSTGKVKTGRLQSKEGARQRLKALCKLYLTTKSAHPSTDPQAFIQCKFRSDS